MYQCGKVIRQIIQEQEKYYVETKIVKRKLSVNFNCYPKMNKQLMMEIQKQEQIVMPKRETVK